MTDTNYKLIKIKHVIVKPIHSSLSSQSKTHFKNNEMLGELHSAEPDVYYNYNRTNITII